jgi:glutamate-1-semialdehyde 2,1-aminomutase
MEEAFRSEGIPALCTGRAHGDLPQSSLGFLVFPYRDDVRMDSPEDVWDPERSDVILRETVLRLALLLEGVHVVHGLGALSTAHTAEDIEHLGECCLNAAKRLKPYLNQLGDE